MSIPDLLKTLEPYNNASTWLFAIVGLPATAYGSWRVWGNRVRVKVRDFGFYRLQHNFVSFVVANISERLTSLEPTYVMTGYTPKREKQSYTFELQGTDYALSQHQTKTVVAAYREQTNKGMHFLWYTTSKICTTTGQCVTLRFRSAELERLGFLRFYWELLLYRVSYLLPWTSDKPPVRAAEDFVDANAARIVAGKPAHPNLQVREHMLAGIECKLVNTSKTEKVLITGVRALNIREEELPITWSDEIDDFGMPQHPSNLISITDTGYLHIRHRMGEVINYAKLMIAHNRPGSPLVAILDDYHDFQ
jgi:hypothetical protein